MYGINASRHKWSSQSIAPKKLLSQEENGMTPNSPLPGSPAADSDPSKLMVVDSREQLETLLVPIWRALARGEHIAANPLVVQTKSCKFTYEVNGAWLGNVAR